MKIYCVGGAVRDQLLGRKVTERDWVVVGSTPEQMLEQGYTPVGKSFPVFLHPVTKEEYALARTEKKVAKGYHGFQFNTDPKVTLEEDLARRDLTINAIAQDDQGQLFDPYHGQRDIQQKVLRHVSLAFAEDPVRILRCARFYARFAQYDFQIAPQTLELMQNMVKAGEVDALITERVFKELERALGEPRPECFFQCLAECHALTVLFPQVAKVWNDKLSETLYQTAKQYKEPLIRFSSLGLVLSADDAKQLAEHAKLPTAYHDLLLLVSQFQPFDPIPQKLLQLLESVDAFRRSERFQQYCQTVATHAAYQPLMTQLQQAFTAASQVNAQSVIATLSDKNGAAIKQAIFDARLAAIADSF